MPAPAAAQAWNERVNTPGSPPGPPASGAAGTAILGVALLKEPVTMWRIGFLILMIVSIVGLKITASVPVNSAGSAA